MYTSNSHWVQLELGFVHFSEFTNLYWVPAPLSYVSTSQFPFPSGRKVSIQPNINAIFRHTAMILHFQLPKLLPVKRHFRANAAVAVCSPQWWQLLTNVQSSQTSSSLLALDKQGYRDLGITGWGPEAANEITENTCRNAKKCNVLAIQKREHTVLSLPSINGRFCPILGYFSLPPVIPGAT